MPSRNVTHKLLHMNCHIARLLGIVGLACAIFALQAHAVYADGMPGGNVADPVVRAVDIANPAVVRIITDVPGKLTVHFSATNSVTFPQTGTPYPLELSGSGAFISGSGDVLTADHVVNPAHDASLGQYLDASAAQDVTDYINQHGTQQVTKTQVVQALDSKQIASDAIYGTTVSIVFFSTAYTGPLTAKTFSDVPQQYYAKVDTIKKQSPSDQKDTAIVHVPLTDTPSVQIGSSTGVQQQDELTIIGFPGNGDVGNSPTSVLSSSINKVIVSSLKTTDNGAPVIQVGGNVEHGDSGGPALSKGGQVVGIVSFGTSNPNSPGSTSFLQASSSAQELVQSIGLNTAPSAFQKLWSQSFSDYAATSAGHWHRAASGFAQMQSNYPNFKAITPYLNYAQDQAKNEAAPAGSPISLGSTPSSSALAWTIGAVTLIALLVFVVIALGFTRKGKKGVPAVSQGYAAQPGQVAGFQTPQNQAPYPTPPNVSPYAHNVSSFGGPQAPVSNQQYPQYPQYPPVPTPGYQQPLVQSVPPFAPAPQAPMGQQAAPQSPDNSGILRPWPCGHLNRSNARFCSICGEPSPAPSASSTFIRRFEQ